MKKKSSNGNASPYYEGTYESLSHNKYDHYKTKVNTKNIIGTIILLWLKVNL